MMTIVRRTLALPLWDIGTIRLGHVLYLAAASAAVGFVVAALS